MSINFNSNEILRQLQQNGQVGENPDKTGGGGDTSSSVTQQEKDTQQQTTFKENNEGSIQALEYAAIANQILVSNKGKDDGTTYTFDKKHKTLTLNINGKQVKVTAQVSGNATIKVSVDKEGKMNIRNNGGTKIDFSKADFDLNINIEESNKDISVIAGKKDDVVTVREGAKVGTIKLGDGHDKFVNAGSVKTVDGENGADFLANFGTITNLKDTETDNKERLNTIVNFSEVNTIKGSGGDYDIFNEGNVTGSITTGNGEDYVTNRGSVKGSISTGNNDDEVKNYGTVGSINTGSGKDEIYNDGIVENSINGGADRDKLVETENSSVKKVVNIEKREIRDSELENAYEDLRSLLNTKISSTMFLILRSMYDHQNYEYYEEQKNNFINLVNAIKNDDYKTVYEMGQHDSWHGYCCLGKGYTLSLLADMATYQDHKNEAQVQIDENTVLNVADGKGVLTHSEYDENGKLTKQEIQITDLEANTLPNLSVITRENFTYNNGAIESWDETEDKKKYSIVKNSVITKEGNIYCYKRQHIDGNKTYPAQYCDINGAVSGMHNDIDNNQRYFKDGMLVTGIADGVLYYAGKVYSGVFAGKMYKDGKLSNERTDDAFYAPRFKDGVLYKGIADEVYTGMANGLYYKDGVAFTGHINGKYYYEGEQYEIRVDGSSGLPLSLPRYYENEIRERRKIAAGEMEKLTSYNYDITQSTQTTSADTQQQAIEAELDSVQRIVQSNIDKKFKIFPE